MCNNCFFLRRGIVKERGKGKRRGRRRKRREDRFSGLQLFKCEYFQMTTNKWPSSEVPADPLSLCIRRVLCGQNIFSTLKTYNCLFY